jgi:predicted dehydrogenase
VVAALHGVVFGLGRMGRLHADRLAARGLKITVVDPALGHPRPAQIEADFAVVATPTQSHVQLAGELLATGMPVLVEKPLAGCVAAALALADSPLLGVGHIERFNPALVPVAHVKPRFVECTRLSPFPDGRGTDVDVISDLMVHDLDLARCFVPGELTEVRAVGVGVVSGRVDICNARLEVTPSEGDRAVVSATCSRVSRSKARQLRLVEPGVYWSVDLLARTAHRVDWGSGELAAEPLDVPEGDSLGREHDAWLAHVRGEAPFVVSGAEALATMRWIEAVQAAVDGSP